MSDWLSPNPPDIADPLPSTLIWKKSKMNQYQKDLVKFVRSHDYISIWTIIGRELQDSKWLDKHQISLVREENKSLPFTIKISLPFGDRKHSPLILSKISYVLSRVVSNLDALIDGGYLVATHQFNLDVPKGRTLFQVGNKVEESDINLIYPDLRITEKIIQKANTLFILSDDAEEFIDRGYMTKSEFQFEKSSGLTTGILKANLVGLSLGGITLLLSALSIFASNRASSNINTSLTSLNEAAEDLKLNLDSINVSFANFQSLVDVLDTSLTKTISTLDKEYDNLNSSISKIDETINEISLTSERLKISTDKFSQTLKKIDYQYSRKPSIEIGFQKCDNSGEFLNVENIVLDNQGSISANIHSITIVFPKNKLKYFDEKYFAVDSLFSHGNYIKIRAIKLSSNFNVLPNQPMILTGLFKFSKSKRIKYKIFVSYRSKNEDRIVDSQSEIKC